MRSERAGRLILVRHGESTANRDGVFAEADDVPLTEAGRLQALQLARDLAVRFKPDLLISSSFLRARQTGKIIAETLGVELSVSEGLHERDFGCLKGYPYARMGELMSRDPSYDQHRSWMWRPEGGESLEDVQRRVIAVLDLLQAKYSTHEIVVVCHGAVIQAICANLTGTWSELAVPPNCGLVVIEGGVLKPDSPYGNMRPPVKSNTDPVT